jgi:hypothetical protein
VVLVARRAERLQELAEDLSRKHGVRARPLAADLAESGAPRAVFDAVADTPIEILINNAGIGLRGAYADTDWQAQAGLLQVNMVALAHLTRLFLPGMMARRSGRILNVGSTAAFVPGPFMATYYASKSFVVSFTHAIANELQGSGVTATVLCPGPTGTEFFQAAGIEDSGLVGADLMDSAAVARLGYSAMMAGRPEVVAGARNRGIAFAARLAPRTMLAGIARRLNVGR